MMIGFLTDFMIISLKVMLEAALGGESAQVLILRPFVVLNNVQSLIVTSLTSASFLYLPRLPILLQYKKLNN